jgi:hypothetical protein
MSLHNIYIAGQKGMALMYPHYHFIFGLALAVVLVPMFEFWQLALFLAATVLIDVDHYIYYVLSRKDYSLMSAYHFFKEKGKKQRSKEHKGPVTFSYLFFHNWEMQVLLALSTIWFPFMWYVLAGFWIHLVLDLIYNPRGRRQFWGYLKSWSLIYRVVKQKGFYAKIEL